MVVLHVSTLEGIKKMRDRRVFRGNGDLHAPEPSRYWNRQDEVLLARITFAPDV